MGIRLASLKRPSSLDDGVNSELLLAGKYGHAKHVWDLHERRHRQVLDLAAEQHCSVTCFSHDLPKGMAHPTRSPVIVLPAIDCVSRAARKNVVRPQKAGSPAELF